MLKEGMHILTMMNTSQTLRRELGGSTVAEEELDYALEKLRAAGRNVEPLMAEGSVPVLHGVNSLVKETKNQVDTGALTSIYSE